MNNVELINQMESFIDNHRVRMENLCQLKLGESEEKITSLTTQFKADLNSAKIHKGHLTEKSVIQLQKDFKQLERVWSEAANQRIKEFNEQIATNPAKSEKYTERKREIEKILEEAKTVKSNLANNLHVDQEAPLSKQINAVDKRGMNESISELKRGAAIKTIGSLIANMGGITAVTAIISVGAASILAGGLVFPPLLIIFTLGGVGLIIGGLILRNQGQKDLDKKTPTVRELENLETTYPVYLQLMKADRRLGEFSKVDQVEIQKMYDLGLLSDSNKKTLIKKGTKETFDQIHQSLKTQGSENIKEKILRIIDQLEIEAAHLSDS